MTANVCHLVYKRYSRWQSLGWLSWLKRLRHASAEGHGYKSTCCRLVFCAQKLRENWRSNCSVTHKATTTSPPGAWTGRSTHLAILAKSMWGLTFWVVSLHNISKAEHPNFILHCYSRWLCKKDYFSAHNVFSLQSVKTNKTTSPQYLLPREFPVIWIT